MRLASVLSAEDSLYFRIRRIAAFLQGEIFRENSGEEMALPLPSAKSFRESFSPYFSGRFLKEHELKKAREALACAEKARTESERFESALVLQILLENFELLRFKRSILAQAPEEKVEMSDLLKLRERFKNR